MADGIRLRLPSGSYTAPGKEIRIFQALLRLGHTRSTVASFVAQWTISLFANGIYLTIFLQDGKMVIKAFSDSLVISSLARIATARIGACISNVAKY